MIVALLTYLLTTLILLRKRELVYVYFNCDVAVCSLSFFLSYVGLQSVIAALLTNFLTTHILLRKRELVYVYFNCDVAVCSLSFFLSYVGLQSVIVAERSYDPDQFDNTSQSRSTSVNIYTQAL